MVTKRRVCSPDAYTGQVRGGMCVRAGMCAQPRQSCLTLATPWTVVCQAPLSMGFSRKNTGIGLPCPPPVDLPNPGIEPTSPTPPALQADSLPLSQQGKPRGDSSRKLIFQWPYPRMTGFCSSWILHLLLLSL